MSQILGDINTFPPININITEDSIWDKIVQKTISGYLGGSMTRIHRGVFENCSGLTSVSFPNVSVIEASTFYGCYNLSYCFFPMVTDIHEGAFGNCSALQSITSQALPLLKNISKYAFGGCTSLSEINLSTVTYISMLAFYNCSSLQTVYLPFLSYIGRSAFYNCYSLNYAIFPSASFVGAYAFCSCSTMSYVSLPNVTSIEGVAFENCVRLTSLYLMGSTPCALLGIRAFSGTPIGGYSDITGSYGSIYVPASLYSTYISAVNWSLYSNRIVSVI